MATYAQWELAGGVLPSGEFEDYGEWTFQKDRQVVNSLGNGIIYHKHTDSLQLVIDGSCRSCGQQVPKGIVFRSRTLKLDEVNNGD